MVRQDETTRGDRFGIIAQGQREVVTNGQDPAAPRRHIAGIIRPDFTFPSQHQGKGAVVSQQRRGPFAFQLLKSIGQRLKKVG